MLINETFLETHEENGKMCGGNFQGLSWMAKKSLIVRGKV